MAPGAFAGWFWIKLSLAWICSQKAALPFFQMPPALAATRERCWVVMLEARPCAAHGCCCSRYCSVMDTQSARLCAPVFGLLSYS